MGKQVDNVNHPSHYEDVFRYRKCECIDVAENLPFCFGSCIKYIWRAGCKGGKEQALEDVRKALWYLERCEIFAERKDERDRRMQALGVAQLIESDSPKMHAIRKILEKNFITARMHLDVLRKQLEQKEY